MEVLPFLLGASGLLGGGGAGIAEPDSLLGWILDKADGWGSGI
jgi:hypothetical protein